MYRIYKTLEEYNEYTENGQKLIAGDLYIVTDDKKVILQTNNIDGEFAVYDMIEPTGNIEITENGEEIDIAQYATATVNVESGNPLFSQYIDGSLTTIDIPEGTTTIGIYAFQKCTGLTSVTIPEGTTSISNYAFQKCTGITSIVVDSANTVYDSRDNCNAIINTSTNVLIIACKNTIIPSSVTSIGNSAFQYCSGLTSITIPDSVTIIDNGAFGYCTGLTDVTIGSGVTSIGNSTFYNCSSLTSVTIEATTPPTLGTDVFTNTNNCPIYVPAASVSSYKTATNWISLSSRIQAIPA